MAFCPQCGHAIEGGVETTARFCPHCGHDTSAAATGQPTVSATAQPAAATPARPPDALPAAFPPMAQIAAKKGTTRLILIVVAVVLLGAWLYHRSHNSSSAGTPSGTPGSPTGPVSPLAAEQWLPVQWQDEAGTVMITGSWTNNSGTTIRSAQVECDQTDNGGNLVVRNNLTIGGPLPPNTTKNFMRLRVGTMSPSTTMVSCRIVNVTPQ